jgi:Arc/MetJ-type ribon-helix-helix transcriptional regulator
MRVSVSIPAQDVALLDDYAGRHSLPSRSAAFRAAIEALVAQSLPDMYEAAWDESAGDRAVWDATLRDGLGDEAW